MKSNNDIRAALFDVDGTLLSFASHGMLDSSYKALEQLGERGIMRILATGRPLYELSGIDTNLFDAFILFNGQYCILNDEVIVDSPINPDVVEIAVNQVDDGLYPCLFMEGDCAYASPKNEAFHKLEALIGSSFPEGDYHRALHNKVYQLNAYVEPGNESLITGDMKNIKWTRWSEHFIDIIPAHGGKEFGISEMFKHLDFTPEQAIAFGDGGNDVGMFKLVGHGVAMGNAVEELKQIAQSITEDCESDGIYNECVRLGLIEGQSNFLRV